VKAAALVSEVRKRTEKIAALLSSTTPPDLVLNRHCAECEFQARCRKIAIDKDDLSLLAGMSAKERQKLRSKGIFTVTQLSYTFRPRRRPKRLRDKRVGRVERVGQDCRIPQQHIKLDQDEFANGHGVRRCG